ncbi:MAG: hypothetical protein HRT77_12365 [Halioglobus sp.]|nr:hypothetical protein [Halioglobus sp.]
MKTRCRVLLASVVCVCAALPGLVNAQGFAGRYPTLGDAAFIPYYTVEGDWVTGVHIINESDETQVIKVRMRRAADSVDVLDFNLILSPEDVWTGTITGDEAEMRFITEDNSCTAPKLLDNGDGKTYAPIAGDRILGAQEGYIEVIGMGRADQAQPISQWAVHANGVPVDCDLVRDNFFVDAVIANDLTVIDTPTGLAATNYADTGEHLKVSYFIRDSASGIEFGNNAVHLILFSVEAMMSHQQYGLENFANEPVNALFGWDFPDVRGGSSLNAVRDSFVLVRFQLGALEVVNDWSYNPATGAATDWLVTFPGQYAMVDYYLQTFGPSDAVSDYREIPAAAAFSIWDREEGTGVPGGLNFSPSPAPDTTTLDYEVNVIEWGGLSVFDSDFVTAVDPRENQIVSPFGWAALAVEARAGPQDGVLGPGVNGWCDVAAGPDNAGGSVPSADGACDMYLVSDAVPMSGFAAWERTFAEDVDRNYGRIVEHGFRADFAPPPP